MSKEDNSIKGIKEPRYFVTESQLITQRRDNIISYISYALAPIILSLAAFNTYPDHTKLLLIAGSIILFIAIYYSCLKDSLIKKLENSPDLEYISIDKGDDIEIIYVSYGSNERQREATEVIKSKFENDKLDMEVKNSVIGFDPHRRELKSLLIIYKQKGKIIRRSFTEGERAVIP